MRTFKKGEWKNGRGVYQYRNGKYEGEWKDDKMNGKGVFYYNKGDKYDGEWKDKKKNGKGVYYYNDGNKYDGEWKDNKMNGKGVFYFNNGGKYDGDKYDGEFKDYKRNGKGVYYYNNGDKYEGELKDNKINGKGVFYYNDGNKYDGEWKDNKKNGKGVFYYNNGDKYDGEWKDDKMNGKGVIYYNGNKYDGEWKDDERNGKGVHYYNNGDKYEGEWKDDKRNGKGVFTKKSGKQYLRKYEKGKFISEELIPVKKRNEFVEMEKYRIKFREIKKEKLLGKGGFGSVFTGKWNGKGGGIDVAIKSIELVRKVTREDLIDFEIVLGLNHPCVINVYGFAVSDDEKEVLIVMEKMDEDVFSFIENNRLSWKEKFNMMRKMTQCLHYIHSNNILHRDLKSMNFLVSNGGKKVKITDFGLATVKNNSKSFIESYGKGTQLWMAPELFDIIAKFSVFSDVFALGMTFFEVLNETVPFEKEMKERKYNFRLGMDKILNAGIRPRIKSDVPSIFKELLENCWQTDPKKRYTTKQILEWFEKNESKI